MISVIMPTMWKSHRTIALLESLDKTHEVSEIIIVDNNVSSRPNGLKSHKFIFLNQQTNIFVNPAWNLGVQKSKEDLEALIHMIPGSEYQYFFEKRFSSESRSRGWMSVRWLLKIENLID